MYPLLINFVLLLLSMAEYLYVSQAHLAPNSQTKFDFQNYIKRSLEEDFKVVVGIRWVIVIPTLQIDFQYSFFCTKLCIFVLI